MDELERCPICGNRWNVNVVPPCSHTDEEWDRYTRNRWQPERRRRDSKREKDNG